MNLKALPALLLLAFLPACATVVVGGGGGGEAGSAGSSGDAGTGGSSGSAGVGGDNEIDPSAVALNRTQMNAAWDAYWASHGGEPGSSSSGGSGTLDPNDLFLRVSGDGYTCAAPINEPQCGGHWDMSLVLPPALQAVGVYDLEDPLIVQYSSFSETGYPNSGDPQDCSFGGGSPGPGTLEIVSIDASEVHFKVTVSAGWWQSIPSGEYVAPRCPVNP